MTNTYFSASHDESGGGGNVTYKAPHDQQQGTAYQIIAFSLGSDSDQCCGGELHLFNPSSTTYVKHFYTRINSGHATEYCEDIYVSGYFNITAAIDQVSFKMASGNMDGTIALYGISKS